VGLVKPLRISGGVREGGSYVNVQGERGKILNKGPIAGRKGLKTKNVRRVDVKRRTGKFEGGEKLLYEIGGGKGGSAGGVLHARSIECSCNGLARCEIWSPEVNFSDPTRKGEVYRGENELTVQGRCQFVNA